MRGRRCDLCTREAYAWELCRQHYNRWMRAGSAERPTVSLPERIEEVRKIAGGGRLSARCRRIAAALLPVWLAQAETEDAAHR